MRIRSLSLLFLCFALAIEVSAQTATTKEVEVYSRKMERNIKNTIILPAGYESSGDTEYPVLFLLHGYGGNNATWSQVTKKTLADEASRYQIIIVCPNGENSWYWDSPQNPESQFETYVSKELVGYVDSTYRTKSSPKGRAITGFSMGGHGGLWLGINHPCVFGACGSLSGGVDIRPFPNSWEMKNALGKYEENKAVWDNHTVINQLHKIKPNTLSIIIDCGTGDFFYDVNIRLHKKMLQMNIAHDFIVRPGVHDHDYWHNAIDYQLLFFSKFFQND